MAAYGYDETLVPLPIQGFATCISGYEELLSAIPVHPLHVCVPLSRPHMQIRLLELGPVYSQDPNAAPPLHARIRVVSLQEHQDYSALSYVWSQEDPGTSQRENRLVIYCDGHQHEARIGPNCWSALWHLSKARRGLTIWVDSVCINQRNDKEKAQQIPLMRAIFESAETTYFWLGEAGKGTDEAINYLATNVLSVSRGTVSDILRAAFALFLRCHTFQVHPHCSALHNIFKRPWIERIWTLQEAVLSCNSRIVCGQKSISWADLICALESIHFFRSKTVVLFFEDSYMPWLNLANLSRWFANGNETRSRRRHRLGSSFDTFNSLAKKVDGQIRCLKWARRICVACCISVALLCPFALTMIVFMLTSASTPIWIPLTGFAPMVYLYLRLLNAAAIFMARKLSLNPNFNVGSHSIVQELRARKVTYPKDMYFGTLGILSDDSFVTEESLASLYKRLCANLVHRTGSLDILLLANDHMEMKCPSWVVNWGLETSNIWGKALEWIPTFVPNPAGRDQQDSVLMHSELRMRLDNFNKSSALNKWIWFSRFVRFVFDVGFSPRSHLQRYRGATPGLRPFWEFRNQGEHLCVHGLVLSGTVCHFAPKPTASSTTESQRAIVVPTAAPELTRIDQMGCILLSNAPGNSEAAAWEIRVYMFTSLVHDALSGMTEIGKAKTVNRVNRFIDGLTKSRNSARLLWTWWRRLLLSTDSNQGTGWVEDLLADDKYLKDRLDAFMESLAAEGLSVVRCQQTDRCTSDLAFAAAAVQDGDSVALVSGVSYPLVLRPCGEQHFKLIGPIFLPRAMDGELVELLTPESVVEIILV